MKKTIEINVPDGYEVDFMSQSELSPGRVVAHYDITVYLKKKEPEFIEVRLCLVTRDDGLPGIFAHEMSEPYPKGFIRYLEDHWRRVEI